VLFDLIDECKPPARVGNAPKYAGYNQKRWQEQKQRRPSDKLTNKKKNPKGRKQAKRSGPKGNRGIGDLDRASLAMAWHV